MAKSPPSPYPGLEIDEDRPLQERVWVAERAAWVVFVLVLLAALAGLTGAGGPLSRATAAGAAVEVDYPRVSRWQTGDEVALKLRPATGEPVTRVTVDGAFSEVFRIDSVQPQPVSSSATGDGVELVFALAPEAGPKEVVLHVTPMKPALPLRAGLSVDGGDPVDIVSYVLP